jgi:hypothetical protein
VRLTLLLTIEITWGFVGSPSNLCALRIERKSTGYNSVTYQFLRFFQSLVLPCTSDTAAAYIGFKSTDAIGSSNEARRGATRTGGGGGT